MRLRASRLGVIKQICFKEAQNSYCMICVVLPTVCFGTVNKKALDRIVTNRIASSQRWRERGRMRSLELIMSDFVRLHLFPNELHFQKSCWTAIVSEQKCRRGVEPVFRAENHRRGQCISYRSRNCVQPLLVSIRTVIAIRIQQSGE